MLMEVGEQNERECEKQNDVRLKEKLNEENRLEGKSIFNTK
jgi:hypothetical protein